MLLGTNYKACVSLLACMILCQLCCSQVPQHARGWPRLQSARRLSGFSESRAWPSAVRRGRTSTRMRPGPERTEIRFLLFVSDVSWDICIVTPACLPSSPPVERRRRRHDRNQLQTCCTTYGRISESTSFTVRLLFL